MLSKSEIKKIQDYFASQKDVAAVYLYGSFAKGNTHKRSDIDFGVLFDPPIKTYFRIGEINNGLADLGLPFEPDVRDIELNSPPAYLFNVINGKLIFSRDEIKRINFEVEALKQYYDTQPLRDIKYHYMDKRFREDTYGY